MRWLKKRLAGGTVQGVTSHIVATYILPLGAPVVTVVIGYISDLPWFWIWLGALAAFAFISHGLLRFDEWRDRRRIDGKLAFQSIVFGRNIRGRGLILGLRFNNLAAFSLEFEVTEVRTRLGDTVPALEHEATKHTVPATGIGWYNDNPIELDNPPHPGTIEGFIRAYPVNADTYYM